MQTFGLVIVWPVMVGGTAIAVYLIITNQDAIARYLGFGFASTVMLSLVTVISQMLVHMTVVAENWHPRQRTNVSTCAQHSLLCNSCAEAKTITFS